MKISTKRFTVTSEAKNDKGFRVRTSGVDISGYEKNPVFLFMHKRPKGERKDEVMPLGNVIKLAFENNALFGVPAFDDTDDFAMNLYSKVENGTIRMFSPGLLPILFAKDANGDIWLEKSKLIEISLVDIGSNSEALAVALYNENEELITLSLEEITNTIKPEIDMKLIQLNADVLPLLKLAAEATPEDVQTAIEGFVTLAAESAAAVKDKELEIVTLTTARDDFETKLNAEVKKGVEAQNLALVTLAFDENKIVKGDIPKWLKLATADYEGTKAVLESMAGQKKVVNQLTGDEKLSEEFTKLSYDDLDKQDKLIMLKAKDLPMFKEKFKAKFGVEYSEK